jgi:simple sugar transport system ATP-binding protein
MSRADPILRVDDVTKRFGDVVANDEVSLSVERGEVHGLLGENGAGKSTLMNVLYGLYSPTSGTVEFKGEQRSFDSPDDAMAAGIGMVHQHFMLVPRMTVLENIVLGERETGTEGGVLSGLRSLFARERAGPRERVEELAAEYGLSVDPDAKVWELDIGERQRVEILKALYRDVDLLILDEPTAVLTPNEAEQMFETIRRLVDEGLTVIFITHKLWEIDRMADRVTVLRDGRKIETVDADGVTQGDLAEMMVGREVLFRIDKENVPAGDPVLDATGLRTSDDRGVSVIEDVDLTVHESEIVGIAGVSGNGQSELAECLVGDRPLDAGRIEIDGADLTGAPPREFVDAGVSFVPEDRYQYGCAEDLSVMHNAGLKAYRNGLSGDRGVLLDYDAMREYASELVEDFDVRGVTDVRETPAGELSGGNLQKLILAREMDRTPRLLVANQPTRGVDVGAIENIRTLMLDQREEGTGVLLVSEDLEELLDVSDRILVIYDGEFVFETTPDETTKWELGVYMSTGESPEADAEPEMAEEAT